MSEREFDAYLKLLSGLLRLAPGQREQIAGELRDHMEERLDALLAAGVSREEAIGQALEEFGDVAALAASFRQIAWNRKRRWIMRWTAASVCGVLLIIATVATFWPQGQPGGLVNAAIAQEHKEAAPPDTPMARNAATRVKLQERVAANFSGNFGDALQDLRELLDVDVMVDWQPVNETGLSNLEKVDYKAAPTRGHFLLDQFLKRYGCGYYLRDGIVVVTSREQASIQLALHFYDCAELLANDPVSIEKDTPPAQTVAAVDSSQRPTSGGSDPPVVATEVALSEPTLAELIMNCTATSGDNGWISQATGAGTISRYNGMLVISQSEEAHHEIMYLLETLRSR